MQLAYRWELVIEQNGAYFYFLYIFIFLHIFIFYIFYIFMFLYFFFIFIVLYFYLFNKVGSSPQPMGGTSQAAVMIT